MHKNIIIIQNQKNHRLIEAWGSLTRLCDNHPEFEYKQIYRGDFPFLYQNWLFTKVPFNSPNFKMPMMRTKLPKSKTTGKS